MNASTSGRDLPSGSRDEAGRLADGPAETDEDEADIVDEMVDESFPGSDPPSTWAGVDKPPPVSP